MGSATSVHSRGLKTSQKGHPERPHVAPHPAQSPPQLVHQPPGTNLCSTPQARTSPELGVQTHWLLCTCQVCICRHTQPPPAGCIDCSSWPGRAPQPQQQPPGMRCKARAVLLLAPAACVTHMHVAVPTCHSERCHTLARWKQRTTHSIHPVRTHISR
jgi:hypothetical protein